MSRNTSTGRSACLCCFEFLIVRDTAADFLYYLAQRRAQRDLHQAGVGDLAAEGEDLGAGALLGAELTEPVCAVEHDGGGLSDIQLRSEGDTLNYRYYNGTYYFERVKPDNTKWMYVSERELVDFEARRVRHPKIAREMEELFNSGQCVFKDGPTLEAFFRYLRRSRTRI